ncbi:MAG: hypothetical protein DMG05_19600 [Acidobacteria bacterium]|nr:MAG: hypothetical protein DMG05_19600 [Acidobacteriota bacterium]
MRRDENLVPVVLVATVNLLFQLAVGFPSRTAHDHPKLRADRGYPGLSRAKLLLQRGENLQFSAKIT